MCVSGLCVERSREAEEREEDALVAVASKLVLLVLHVAVDLLVVDERFELCIVPVLVLVAGTAALRRAVEAPAAPRLVHGRVLRRP